MGNTAFRFLASLFTGFLWFILFINFCGWSGFNPATFLGWNTEWKDNSYFGFMSLTRMIDNFKNLCPPDGFYSAQSIFKYFTKTINYCAGNIPFLIDSLVDYFNSIGTNTFASIQSSDNVLQYFLNYFIGYITDFHMYLNVLFNALKFFFAPLIALFYAILTFASSGGFLASFIWNFFTALNGGFNVVYDFQNGFGYDWSPVVNYWNWNW